MNRKSILPITAITGASVLAITALFAIQGTRASFVLGEGNSVPHEIVFDKDDVGEVLSEEGYYLTDLSTTTAAGNTFASTNLEIYDTSSTGLLVGGESDDYIFLIHNPSWKYYVPGYAVFTIDFEMNVDIAEGVTATLTRTTHYDDGSSSSDSQKVEDFLILTDDNLAYTMEYTFEFENKNYEYVTIDAVTINYSCTY